MNDFACQLVPLTLFSFSFRISFALHPLSPYFLGIYRYISSKPTINRQAIDVFSEKELRSREEEVETKVRQNEASGFHVETYRPSTADIRCSDGGEKEKSETMMITIAPFYHCTIAPFREE